MSIEGRAGGLLLLAVALLACIAILAWATWSPSPAAPAAAGSGRPAPLSPVRSDQSLEPGPEHGGTAGGAPRQPGPGEVSADPDFRGRGTIRGEIVGISGAPLPDRWTLLVEPHPWLQGRERADTRRLEFEHGEREFLVEDLPLGGYQVRALSSELNDVPASVLLVRGSSDQFVTVGLAPSGFLDGGVLDAEGRPAAGLDVTLESVESLERRTMSTDAAGTFLFRDVLDGEYLLMLGRPDSPLLPAQSLVFRAPSMRFPTRTLPPTGSIAFRVFDERGRPVAQARISGTAGTGGAIDAYADHLGEVTVRYLVPGRYRIEIRDDSGLVAHTSVELDAGEEKRVQTVLLDRSRIR